MEKEDKNVKNVKDMKGIKDIKDAGGLDEIKVSLYVCKICGARLDKMYPICPKCNRYGKVIPIGLEKLRFSGTFEDKIIRPQVVVYRTGQSDIDKVFGDVFSDRTLSILAGREGVGKSTLATQIAYWLANQGLKVSYFSTEESLNSLLERIHRLGFIHTNFKIYPVHSLQEIIKLVLEERPKFFIVDSLQTVKDMFVPGHIGTVKQIETVINKLNTLVHSNPLFALLISHITKSSGYLSGPTIVGYQADAIFFLNYIRKEGGQERILFAYKNRRSTTKFTSSLIMTDKGLVPLSIDKIAFQHSVGKTYTITSVNDGLIWAEVASYESASRGVTILNYKNDKYFSDLLIKETKEAKSGKNGKNSKNKGMNGIIVRVDKKVKDDFIKLSIFCSVLSYKYNVLLPFTLCTIASIEPDGSLAAPPDVETRILRAIDLGFNEFFLPRNVQSLLDSELFTENVFHFFDNIDEVREIIQKMYNKDEILGNLDTENTDLTVNTVNSETIMGGQNGGQDDGRDGRQNEGQSEEGR